MNYEDEAMLADGEWRARDGSGECILICGTLNLGDAATTAAEAFAPLSCGGTTQVIEIERWSGEKYRFVAAPEPRYRISDIESLPIEKATK